MKEQGGRADPSFPMKVYGKAVKRARSSAGAILKPSIRQLFGRALGVQSNLTRMMLSKPF